MTSQAPSSDKFDASPLASRTFWGGGKPILVAALCLCLVAFGTLMWNLVGPGAWSPRVECDSEFDFGTVAGDSSLVRHVFRIGNTGFKEAHLTINGASCGCVNVRVGTVVIPPLSSVDLPVDLNVSQLRGRGEQFVLISTNDPGRPQMQLKLIANVPDINSSGS